MREQFEKLPEISEYLNDAEWSEITGRYIAKRVNHYRSAIFLNGAWYAYQEQQRDYVCDCGFLDSVDEPLIIDNDDLKNELTRLSRILSFSGKENFLSELEYLMDKNGIPFNLRLLK